MTDEVKNFLFYTLGVILSLLLAIHKIKSEYGDEWQEPLIEE